MFVASTVWTFKNSEILKKWTFRMLALEATGCFNKFSFGKMWLTGKDFLLSPFSILSSVEV